MHKMSCPHCGKEMEMAEMEKHKKMIHPDKETHADNLASTDAGMNGDMNKNAGTRGAGMDETESE